MERYKVSCERNDGGRQMRMKKRVTISVILLTLVMILSGCGGISEKQEEEARQLIIKMITAADGAVVTQSDCTTEFEAKLTYDGSRTRYFWGKYETHNEYDKESGRVDSEVTLYEGEEFFKSRFHMNEEMGVFYIYAKQDKYNWIKYDACFLKDDMSRNFVSDMNLENAEIVGFKKDYKKVNEKNAHKLSVKLKDASIRELIFEAGFKMLFWGREYNSIDLRDVSVRVDYYVDPETGQVVELEVLLDGMEEFLREYARLTDKSAYEDFKESKINKGKLIYKNISYEDVKVPMLSFEDKKSSRLIFQQDSTYNLKALEAEAEFVCPKGWFVFENESHQLRIASLDGQRIITYSLCMPYTDEDFKKQFNNSIESHKADGNYVSDQKGPQIGDFETYELVTLKGNNIYAITSVNQTMLVIIFEDYSGSDNDAEISEILKKAKLKAIEF